MAAYVVTMEFAQELPVGENLCEEIKLFLETQKKLLEEQERELRASISKSCENLGIDCTKADLDLLFK